MAAHSLKTVQKIPASMQEVWKFFCSPENLKEIADDYMQVNIISRHHGPVMYEGQIIEYKVRPLWNIPMYWMTEITKVEDQKYFIDEQRFGPYKFWHHQHHFRAIAGGVEMTDIVHYMNPFGFVGRIANALIVKRQLDRIFRFRYQKAEQLFGKWPGAQQVEIEIS